MALNFDYSSLQVGQKFNSFRDFTVFFFRNTKGTLDRYFAFLTQSQHKAIIN